MTNKVTTIEKFQTNLDSMLQKGIKALPNDVNSDRLKLNALMYVANEPKLKELALSKPALVAQIVYNFIALGLDMMNRECYIIPFGDKPTIIRDYKGEEKLAKKYSIKPIKNIYSNVVRKNDEKYGFDDDGHFVHKFNPFDSDEQRGDIIGSYCKVVYDDGSVDIEFVNLDEIKRVKAVSKTAHQNDSPWNKWQESMFRKTAVKKMMKHIPLDFGKYVEPEQAQTVQKAFNDTDNDVDFERKPTKDIVEQDEPIVIDVEYEEVKESL